jgi:hypothetical protein
MKKNEVIKLVNESAGSLFTKEDVVDLINKVESEGSVNLEELCDRVLAIVEDADTNDIEIDNYNTEFTIRNNNEVEIEDVKYDTNSYIRGIQHDIRELFASVEEADTEYENTHE